MNERWIAPAFVVAFVSAIGFCVTYALGGHPQWEGITIFGAFAGLGTGLVLWAKHLFPKGEVEQERHDMTSSPEDLEEFASLVQTGAGDYSRRRFLSRLGLTALGGMGLAALFPLKSLGPNPGDTLFHTEWARGIRLVMDNGTPIRPTDLDVGGVLTVWPEGRPRHESSATLLIRVPRDQFKPKPGRETWAPQGNVAYSKICTHVGCPVGLYREKTHELLCPCHQSTFLVLEHAKPVFGPASRSLPQLPLAIDEQGYLIAQSDYHEPVGGGFWNRDKRDKNPSTAGMNH